MTTPFDFEARTRIVFGPNKLDQLGELAVELGARRVLVVSDPGIVQAGHVARGIESLQQARLETLLFDGVAENPTTHHVASGLAVARDYRPDLIVGLGGGSSMDCAKGINFLYSCGGEMRDYWGVGKATGPLLPMIAVPTTAGTGSEAQSFALISDAATRAKMACGDKRAAFRVALLDPALTLSQPERVTALTGIDAVSHAVETFVTKTRNPLSLTFSREAWRLLSANFLLVLQRPEDPTARAAMQLGACFAGLAIENSMLGAAHALANPLTAAFGTPHGQAVAVMLPHVVRFNGQTVGSWYADMLATTHRSAAHQTVSEWLAHRLTEFTVAAKLATRLRDLSVPRDQLPNLAADAAQQWTAGHNPRPVNVNDLLELYERAY